MKDITVLILASVAGMLGLAKAIYDFRQSRIRPLARNGDPKTRVLRLETTPEKLDTSSGGMSDKILLWMQLLIGIALIVAACYGYWNVLSGRAFLDFPPTSFALNIGLLTMFLLGVAWVWLWGWYISLFQPTKPGDPIHSSSANMTVRADLPTIVRQCQEALNDLNALRDKATQLATDSDKHARLEGGTGAWPRNTRGHKITIVINKQDQESYTLEIRSSTYWPGFSLFLKKKDAANVVRIVQQFF